VKLIKVIVSAVATLTFAPTVFAQDAAPPATASAATYSDEDVKTYAAALVAVNKLQTDTSIPDTDKQAKMAAAVQQAGIDIPKFNAMTQAMQADKTLQTRIQTAAASAAH
jgi:hypothetical protein